MNGSMEQKAQREWVEVFVYGTLRHEEANHHIMVEGGGKWIREACTEAAFELADLGAYPGLLEGGTVSVVGDVYRVNSNGLRLLDALEGHPWFYRRTHIRLACGQMVQTYVLPTSHAVGRPRIQSGDWPTYRALRDVRATPG